MEGGPTFGRVGMETAARPAWSLRCGHRATAQYGRIHVLPDSADAEGLAPSFVLDQDVAGICQRRRDGDPTKERGAD
jgi:hypothetical protein